MEVLEGLAKESPTNGYRIAKKTGKAYSFVFNSLKELEKHKIVFLKGKEKSRKGTMAKIYDLSLEGVLRVLHNELLGFDADKWNRPFIRQIMEKHSSMLPLIFGKWNYFKKSGSERTVFLRLKWIVDTHANHPFERGAGFYPWLEMEEQITRFFFLVDIYRLDNQFISNFDARAWLTGLKQDKEIAKYVIQELENEKRRLKNMQARIDDVALFMKIQSEKSKTDVSKMEESSTKNATKTDRRKD
jgi:hypothetical protein